MNKNIVQFIQQQTCATICCIDEQSNPYCFCCFYAFNQMEGLLYFKSSVNTLHSTLIKKNPVISGTILPDKLSKVIVKGVQFEGIVLDTQHPLVIHALKNYHNKHPLANTIPGEIWTIQINHIKMTDNTNMFGDKKEWLRNDKTIELIHSAKFN